MTSISDKISVQRESRQYDMLISQITASNLKRTFQVDPDSVWLRDIDQGTAYFPDKDGNFNLKDAGVKYFQDLAVEGPSASAAVGQGASTSGSVPRMGPGGSIGLPPMNPIAGSASSSRKKEAAYSLKITKAEPTIREAGQGKKPSFTPICHMYLEITEVSANVTLIKAAIQRKWGAYTLVTSDGVELEDSSGTEGLAFWKAPKRKFFAIPQNPKNDSVTALAVTDLTEEPASKRPKQQWTQLEEAVKSITDLKTDVAQILQVNKDMSIPLGLCQALSDVLKCKICHTVPMRPPIIYAKCCKSIVGCEECMNSWYNGEDALTKACPLCGLGRGYNETMRIMGFDNFIKKVQNLFTGSANASED